MRLSTCHLQFAICHLPLAICHLPLAICHLQFAICHLPFAICNLPLTCHLQLSTFNLPLVTCNLPLVRQLIRHVWCAVGNRVTDIGRSSPIDRVANDALHVFVVERAAELVTGLEVEDLARTAVIAKARAENETVLEP